MMIGLVLSLFFIAIALPITALVSNADPAHIILEQVLPTSSPSITALKLIFRAVLLQFVAVEGCACVGIIIMCGTSAFTIMTSNIRLIAEIPPTENALRIYFQLRCLLQIGFECMRFITSQLMGLGFLIATFATWVLVRGWKLFPPLLYTALSVITVAIYIGISQTLPKCVNSHKYSQHLLEVQWPKANVDCWQNRQQSSNNAGRRQYKVWKKMLRAQRTITWYYGMAAFDMDTKTNFYESIFDHALDLILIT